jgi:trimethylamine--corrinoid protein Co-methyltransferase
MATSFIASVIDNDMLGIIRRSGAKIEVNETTLALDSIKDVVNGDGHFLGQPETYERMRSDYLYPIVSDRRSHQDWKDAGSPKLIDTAKTRVEEILSSTGPTHLKLETINEINKKFELTN